MDRHALEIASWGVNVYVKISVINTKREACYALVKKLAERKVKLNVTGIMTLEQVRDVFVGRMYFQADNYFAMPC
jgi:transaldolase